MGPRILLRIALLLGLGLSSTIAIAWAFAFIPVQDGGTRMTAYRRWHALNSAREGWIGIDAWVHIGATRCACMIVSPEEVTNDTHDPRCDDVEHFAPAWARETLLTWTRPITDWPVEEFYIQGVDARGFPFNALWCSYARNPITEPDMWYWLPGGGIELGDGLMPPIEADWYPRANLPCRPVWRGLIADTAIYTGAWWGLLAAPGMLIRRSRLRRGHCPSCNYDLCATPPGLPCPECGHTAFRPPR